MCVYSFQLHPFTVKDVLSCFHFRPYLLPVQPSSHLYQMLSYRISSPQNREESAEKDLGWPWSSVKAFGRANIPNVTARAFFNKRGKKEAFFQMLEKSNICSCKCNPTAVFVKDGKWGLTLSQTPTNGDSIRAMCQKKPSSFKSFVQLF